MRTTPPRMMLEKNNGDIANVLIDWLGKKKL
jgi:hypothetical protein